MVVQGECEYIIHVAHVSCFKHASQLGDVVDGHLKCFKHHLWKNHLLKASHVKKSIILIFPLCLVLLCSTSSLLFNHHSSLGELFIIHFLVDMHQGNSFVEPLFALAHFLVLWYLLGFFSLVFSLALLSFLLLLNILCLNWLMWGFWSNPTHAQVDYLLVCLLIFLLLSIFVALQMASRFWASCLDLFLLFLIVRIIWKCLSYRCKIMGYCFNVYHINLPTWHITSHYWSFNINSLLSAWPSCMF